MSTAKCKFETCDDAARGRGYCPGHYRQLMAGEELRPKRKAGAWGPWYPSTKGYIVRRRTNPATGEREHQRQNRYVMEQHLGRPLLTHEEVHHRNGHRADNAIENLELWSTSQPKGQRVSEKVEWAVQFLTDLGYTVDSGRL